MNAQQIISAISPWNLLKHPYYQAWTTGELPMDSIKLYAQQYYHHVKAFPRYVSATHSNCEELGARQNLLDNLIEEEKGSDNHPELWLRFAEGLGQSREVVKNSVPGPAVQNIVDTFLNGSKKSYASGLGLLLAYESQVPEVAKFKIDSLKKNYDVNNPKTLQFFEVHKSADQWHSEVTSKLIDDLPEAERAEAAQAAEAGAKALWGFLDSMEAQRLQ